MNHFYIYQILLSNSSSRVQIACTQLWRGCSTRAHHGTLVVVCVRQVVGLAIIDDQRHIPLEFIHSGVGAVVQATLHCPATPIATRLPAGRYNNAEPKVHRRFDHFVVIGHFVRVHWRQEWPRLRSRQCAYARASLAPQRRPLSSCAVVSAQRGVRQPAQPNASSVTVCQEHHMQLGTLTRSACCTVRVGVDSGATGV